MDDFGDRMKLYEQAEAGRMLMPLLPVIARLDGKCFSRLTKDLDRPFDSQFNRIMTYVTESLVRETNACIGYTQSDEITLVYFSDSVKSQLLFNGKIQKLVSVLPSMATSYFNDYEISKAVGRAIFDCRVWQVPNKTEAANAVLWREMDAAKNSITMAAQSVYSHNELHGKSGAEKQDMLHQKGINWNDYPACFKRGCYYQRRKTVRKFNAAELHELPEKHEARNNPELEVERTDVTALYMPVFSKVTNRVETIFDGADPITKK